MSNRTPELSKPTRRGLYVGGEWISGYGKPLKSTDPYNGELLYEARMAAPTDVSRAVSAAKNKSYRWMAMSLEERLNYVRAFEKELKDVQEKLALTISQEVGKPLWEAKTEVAAAIAKVGISIQSYEERCKSIHFEKGSTRFETRHRAHGVVAVLGPFNFPLHLPNGHIVPALIAGNTVIFKPSDQTPLVGEMMVQCWERAGVPPGVVNLLQGRGDIGKALSENEEVDGIFFTGSVEVGKALQKSQAGHLEKILALELGGNNPLIVSHVSDLDAAVYQAILSSYITTGQRCTAARRMIVIDSESNRRFVEKFIDKTLELKVGHFKEEPEPFLGPLISEAAVVRALTAQSALQAFGGTSLIRLEHLRPGTGLVCPGLIDVTEVENLPDKELFAPLLQLIWVNSLGEAIAVASKTKFGLSASLFSDSKEEYDYVYPRLKAGLINWNQPTTGASSAQPFGGVGLSGNHRPSAYYAADYCAYPIASTCSDQLILPETPLPGI